MSLVQSLTHQIATSSSSQSLTLAAAPVNGDILFIIFNSINDTLGPEISSITQTGVNWTANGAGLQPSYVYDTDYGIIAQIWMGFVGPNASTSITLNFVNSNGVNPASIAQVLEFKGIRLILDQKGNIDSDTLTTTPSTGSTPATTKFFEFEIGNICGFAAGVTTNTFTNPSPGTFNLVDGTTYYYGPASGTLTACAVWRLVTTKAAASCSVTSDNGVPDIGTIVTYKAAIIQNFSESLVIRANSVKTTRYRRRGTESLTIRNVLARQIKYKRLLIQSLSFSELFSYKSHVHSVLRYFIENLSVLSESFSRKAVSKRPQTETTVVLDIFKRTVTNKRRFTEQIITSEQFKKISSISRRFIESLPISDSFKRGTLHTTRKMVETLVVTESIIKKGWSAFRRWVENLVVPSY